MLKQERGVHQFIKRFCCILVRVLHSSGHLLGHLPEVFQAVMNPIDTKILYRADRGGIITIVWIQTRDTVPRTRFVARTSLPCERCKHIKNFAKRWVYQCTCILCSRIVACYNWFINSFHTSTRSNLLLGQQGLALDCVVIWWWRSV